MALLDKLEHFLLSGSMVALLLGAGVWLTLRSGIFQLRGLPFILKNTVGTLFQKDNNRKEKGISPFQAVTTALAGTMGVGNIAGVATALVAGGPGAIFWMWVGAFFGMTTKYAEIFLAVKHRRRDKDGRYYGGPMYYMQDSTGSRTLGCIFAALCAACSFGIGNMTQVNSVSTAMRDAFAVPTWVSGVVVATIVALVVFGGVKRIARFNELMIPAITIVYLCCSGAFLWIHRAGISDAFALIFREAFHLRTAAGGLAGYGISRALSTGLSRGVFTNEAGLGSAPIAHSSADCKSPAHQGVWGIFEVFLDTIVVCTITALIVLIAGNGCLWQSGLDGAPLTSAAFADVFGSFGGKFVAVSLLIFAVSGMLGWCFYGESALNYLFRGNQTAIRGYRLAYLACIIIGAVAQVAFVWRLSDCLNALMAIPNMIALFRLRGEIQFPQLGPSAGRAACSASGRRSRRQRLRVH